MMNKALILTALLAAPTLTFAGGMGNTSYTDMMNNASSASSNVTTSTSSSNTSNTTTTVTDVSQFGSTENPVSIVEAREVSGSTNENYVRYSFGFIPQSYWNQYIDLGDANGLIELEEYLGETERQTYNAGEDVDREAERQERARNKALRLRSTYGY